MTNFTDLGLSPALLKALADEGYTTPTPIQAQAIPHVLAGRDLLGIAQTGTGKTAAFALPTLQRLATNRRPAMRKGARLLVLSPTRELATQIAESFRTYGRHMQLSVATMFGGVSHRPQIAATRNGVDVLVATPGRLIDHIEEKNVELSGTEILMLDEADQMLDMGFIRPIKTILGQLRRSGRTCSSRPRCRARPMRWPPRSCAIPSRWRSRRAPRPSTASPSASSISKAPRSAPCSPSCSRTWI